MKAIQIYEFGQPEVMHMEDIPSPVPAAGEILIDIKAVGVNPVDTYIRAGWYGPREFPFTPGFDAAGVVLKVGEAVLNITAGQRVYTSGSISGTYAQQCICRESQVHPLPENITFAQGAALGIPYGTAYRSLFQRADADAGKTVFIHGASGGVGLAAVQFARAAGMKIIATAGTEEGRQLLLQQGANLALDHHTPEHFDRVLEFTNGRGVDILLEMLANVNLGRDLTVMAPKGQIVVIGSRGTVEINPRDIMSRETTILGTMSGLATDAEKAQAYKAIETGLTDGTLCPVIAQEIPLCDAPKAHHEVIESTHKGKVLLLP